MGVDLVGHPIHHSDQDMTAMHRIALSPVSIVLLLLVCGCSATDDSIAEIQVAERFRIAVNQNDVASLSKLAGQPLIVQEQEWESAQDGSGFVLGARNEVKIDQKKDVEKFLAAFALRVKIEGEQAIFVPPNEYSGFSAEFGNAVDQWRDLHVYLFKRGEGDVEHVVLIGIHPVSRKVHAIYCN